MKLSTEFYKQLNSIKNFSKLDYNDPQVVAIRMRADHELAAMDNNRNEKELIKAKSKFPAKKRIKRTFIYEMYQGNKLLAKGTAIEVSKILGIKERTIHQMSYESYHKQINKNKNRYAEKVGYLK